MYKEYIENDPELVIGKQYLVMTFGDNYHIAQYTGRGFFGLPLMVKAWCDFERYGDDFLNNKEIGLIFKGISHILANQEKIMRHFNDEDYQIKDTNELSVLYGKLSEQYYREEKHDEKP